MYTAPNFGHKFTNGLGPDKSPGLAFLKAAVGDPFLLVDSEGNCATGISLEGLKEAARREWGIRHFDEEEN